MVTLLRLRRIALSLLLSDLLGRLLRRHSEFPLKELVQHLRIGVQQLIDLEGLLDHVRVCAELFPRLKPRMKLLEPSSYTSIPLSNVRLENGSMLLWDPLEEIPGEAVIRLLFTRPLTWLSTLCTRSSSPTIGDLLRALESTFTHTH